MEDNTSKLQWYVVSTTTGYENKVKLNLENKIINLGLQDQITDIYIPTVTYTVTDKKGNVKTKEEKITPNYVYIRMISSEKTNQCVFETENVINFVGPSNQPTPLSEAEIARLGIVSSITTSNFKIDDYVEILEGPLKGFKGKITELSEDGQNATVLAVVFNRETPVGIETKNIQKI